MIDLVKDLPYEYCETCQVFEPEIEDQTKMFGDGACLVNEITISCSRYKLCREVRRQLESNKEGKTDGAE